MDQILLDPCKYSFIDLLRAVYNNCDPDIIRAFYSLSHKERNIEIRRLCKLAGWYCQDIIGFDKLVYTSFSPYLRK